MFTAEYLRRGRLSEIQIYPTESHYVVTVPRKGQNGPSERVAYGLSIGLSKRAATQLMKAVQPHYKGKPRAIMVKTARKDGLI